MNLNERFYVSDSTKLFKRKPCYKSGCEGHYEIAAYQHRRPCEVVSFPCPVCGSILDDDERKRELSKMISGLHGCSNRIEWEFLAHPDNWDSGALLVIKNGKEKGMVYPMVDGNGRKNWLVDNATNAAQYSTPLRAAIALASNEKAFASTNPLFRITTDDTKKKQMKRTVEAPDGGTEIVSY